MKISGNYLLSIAVFEEEKSGRKAGVQRGWDKHGIEREIMKRRMKRERWMKRTIGSERSQKMGGEGK